MNLPSPLVAAIAALHRHGARPLVVGGSVRDWLLGLTPKDFDVEVYGMDFETVARVLSPLGHTDMVGRSFGVLKLRMDGVEYDFSLPRRESKTGAGHRGFAVAPEPGLTVAEAAARRDFTINAIAFDPVQERVIDPLGGEKDLHDRVLRRAGPGFAEDPLRVLRAFQLAARFGLRLDSSTAAECRAIRGSYSELAVERVWGEWEKWATKGSQPSRGLEVLKQTGWMEHFPEIAALDGLPQEPDWHPEGDVLVHTGLCLDAMVRLPAWLEGDGLQRRILSFAVLGHDFGKATTTERAERAGRLRWISPGHEAAGGPLVESFLRKIAAPLHLVESVRPLVINHLVHHHSQAEYTETAVRRLARRLAPATVGQLITVMEADHFGRPPLVSSETAERIARLRITAERLELQAAAPRPLLLGRHLVAEGLAPSPGFKVLLDAAFEAQLDGAFSDEAGAREWLQNHLRATGRNLA